MGALVGRYWPPGAAVVKSSAPTDDDDGEDTLEGTVAAGMVAAQASQLAGKGTYPAAAAWL
jgi:hypothetical protein